MQSHIKGNEGCLPFREAQSDLYVFFTDTDPESAEDASAVDLKPKYVLYE